MKVVVYAICKNEEKFVPRWVASMKEADEIYVLDTGSSDNTVSLLKKLGVHVEKKTIKPWRFDVARNESLNLLPKDTDICVCTDLDEVFESGWRKKLEDAWQNNTTRASYTYNWNFDEKNNPTISFYIEKIHKLDNYKWINPVHEVLSCDGNEDKINIPDIVLNHFPDNTKSRGSYLPLLELAVKEDPSNDRNLHYLGREYMYYEKYQEAIDTLIKHLHLPSAVWKEERCASMRFIGRCYKLIKRYDEARLWYEKAICECPTLRDPYVEMALLEYELNNWENVKDLCLKALEITTREKIYINETFSWDYTIYDLLSLSYYYLNDKDEAIKYIEMAIEMDLDNERLLANKKIIENIQ